MSKLVKEAQAERDAWKARAEDGTEKGAVGSGFFIPSSNGLRLITCELMHSL